MAIAKRIVLDSLSKKELVEWAYERDIPSPTTMSKQDLVDALAKKRSLETGVILDYLKRDQLKALCREAGLPDHGRAKQDIIDRLLGGDGATGSGGSGRGQSGSKTTKESSRGKSMAKKPIEQYEHKDKERANNPPVGLVTPETDPAPPPEKAKTRYRYDWHLDPELNFDPNAVRDDLASVIEDGLSDEVDSDAGPSDEGATPASTLAEDALGDDLAKTKAELERTRAALDKARSALTTVKKAQEPYLNWSGKAERTSFEVSTVSLHVHERIDPKTIIEAVKARNGDHGDDQMGLFEQPKQNPRLAHAVEFYKHPHGWSNRLIAGDSLLVMNSLIEKEGLGGKLQMVYIDPPYGVKYGSNFQPFVNQRDVKDKRDSDLTREPEMLKAFRDTWELGLHSYLSYMRDRLMVSRDLLNSTGSCFVQISDENLHHVRELMDEVFEAENYCKTIFFKKTAGDTSVLLPNMGDYILWYAKDKSQVKYRQPFVDKRMGDGAERSYKWIALPDKTWRPLTKDELADTSKIPSDARPFAIADLKRAGYSPTATFDYEFEGTTYHPGATKQWKTNRDGLERLRLAGLLHPVGENLRYRRYLDHFPLSALGNTWMDTETGSFTQDKVYVVQTSQKVIERCLLMTTDPGDAVLDPTCGSGTTAMVAERWGRRWLTCDTSRVSVALAKQRLVTSCFDYYELADDSLGISGGLRYRAVPHVTLKSVANNPHIAEGMTPGDIERAVTKFAPVDTLFDQPNNESAKARVAGPFTVEAVPSPTVAPIADVRDDVSGDSTAARSGETRRQADWRDELLRSGARGELGVQMSFSRVQPFSGGVHLHADGEVASDGEFRGRSWRHGDRVVIAFGPEHSPMEQRQVEAAWREAASLVPKPSHVVFCAFQFDPEAAKDIDDANPALLGMTFFRAEMNDDLHTEDLKKKRSSNESFWLIGQPDVTLSKIKSGDDKGKLVVEVNGFDYFNLKEQTIDSGGPDKIAMWMLDTDYDDRSLYPRQVFFPMAGKKDGWSRLAKTLKAEIDQERIEAYRGTKSLPFAPGRHGKVAVKVVDDRGFESLVIRNVSEAD
ncbi:MAG: DNA methyltransferase [Planctomycetota bacterium]